jgi:hypothetical protein
MQERPQTLDYEPLNGTGSRRVNRFVASLTLGVLGAAASLYFVGSARLAVAMGVAAICLGLFLPQRELSKLLGQQVTRVGGGAAGESNGARRHEGTLTERSSDEATKSTK